MTMAALAAVSLGANIFGGIQASAAAERQRALINEAIARIDALQIPDITKKIIYDQYMSIGDFTPQLLDKVIEENAPLALIKEDPKYRQRMEATLAQQEQLTKGPSAQGELELEKARRRTNQDVLSQMAGIESKAKQTGTYSGGAALAAKMKAAQAGADRAAMENLGIASQTEQNRSQNLENFIRNLSAEEQRKLAVQSKNVEARNLRDELLMRNAMSREQANKGALNAAALRNLQERQRAFEANTGVNIAEQRRVGYEAPMAMYNARLEKEKARNALSLGLAGVEGQRGQNTAQMWSGIGSGVMNAGMGYAGLQAQGARTDAMNNLAASNNRLASGGGYGGGYGGVPFANQSQPMGMGGFNMNYGGGFNAPVYGPEYNPELLLAGSNSNSFNLNSYLNPPNQSYMPNPWDNY